MTRIAFAGASGTGKTALAEYIARRYGLPICPIGSRSVAKAMGYSNPYDVDRDGKRAEFQHRLLNEKREWEAKHDEFVTDRSTIDNLVYSSLHDIDCVTDAFLEAIIESAKRYTRVFYCPLAIFQKLGDDPIRVRRVAYHEIFDALLEEMLTRHVHTVNPLFCEGIDARRKKIDSFF